MIKVLITVLSYGLKWLDIAGNEEHNADFHIANLQNVCYF